MKTIVFGTGCFWCAEAAFEMLKGVSSVKSGYAGGHVKNPTYEQVCSQKTGHAEVVRVEYDEKQIELEKLLEVFLTIHDPTSLNKQSNDVGPQYRSVILYSEEAQKRLIDGFLKKAAADYTKPIVTEVKRLEEFYPAEAEHDEFYRKNKLNPYCALVISPKVAKMEKKFGSLIHLDERTGPDHRSD